MSGNWLEVDLRGIGWWSPAAPDWPSAAALLQEGAAWPGEGAARPAAHVLSPNERRRAPEPVRIACEAAAQACEAAGCAPGELPSVFTSIHGDLGITDAMCAALAMDPATLSPTKFHNSVHNAPAGYWTMATGCREASTSVSAWQGSFAAGLLETLVQCRAEARATLLVSYDIANVGALGAALPESRAYAFALVVAPSGGRRASGRLRARHVTAPAPAPKAPAATSLQPLLRALATRTPACLRLPAGPGTALELELAA
ncbi:MAG: beta-ketoacyl synthase chain length factor [Xanthomonadales bacterium]|nr:beta-ketoacyl synthase chain length factor [Xanthomonadales bacterium]